MAYATAQDVATYMGRSLTSDQLVQATFYLEAASAWIDQQTGKSWNPSSPTTEIKSVRGDFVYVYRRPITGVTQVRVRSPYVGSSWVTLASGTGYEIADASRGLLRLASSVGFPGISPYDTIEITYTHNINVPANVKLAAILLAASKMNASMNPIQQRVRSINDNRAISVVFRDEEISAEVRSLLPPRSVYIV